MPSVVNHLIHPLTYTADNGETRYLSSEDCSRVKNFVLAGVFLAVIESLHSSRSLKSSIIIIIVTASVVFYIATAILKMLDRGERPIDPRDGGDRRTIAHKPPRSELPREEASPQSNPNPAAQQPSARESQKMDPASSKSERDRKLREQEQALADLTKGLEELDRERASLEAIISYPSTRPVDRQPPPQPASRAVPPSRQESSSAPSTEFKMPEILSRVSTAIFGEEDFNIKPAWIDQEGFGAYTFQKNYFASLWDSMYGSGNAFLHNLSHSAEDTDLRIGKYKLMEGAPWASFAKHAQKKLQEEWNKKSDFGKAVSSLLS